MCEYCIRYQGEANSQPIDQLAVNPPKDATTTGYYSAYLNEMIADWRDEKRMGDFAFMPMMLPPSVAANDSRANTDETYFPAVRTAEVLAMPRLVLSDCISSDTFHDMLCAFCHFMCLSML